MFSDNLEKVMKARGVSIRKMCADLDMSYNTPTYWKNHNLTPKLDTVKKIAEYLGVTADELIGFKVTEEPPRPMSESEKQLLDLIRQLDVSQLSDLLLYVQFLHHKKAEEDARK